MPWGCPRTRTVPEKAVWCMYIEDRARVAAERDVLVRAENDIDTFNSTGGLAVGAAQDLEHAQRRKSDSGTAIRRRHPQ